MDNFNHINPSMGAMAMGEDDRKVIEDLYQTYLSDFVEQGQLNQSLSEEDFLSEFSLPLSDLRLSDPPVDSRRQSLDGQDYGYQSYRGDSLSTHPSAERGLLTFSGQGTSAQFAGEEDSLSQSLSEPHPEEEGSLSTSQSLEGPYNETPIHDITPVENWTGEVRTISNQNLNF